MFDEEENSSIPSPIPSPLTSKPGQITLKKCYSENSSQYEFGVDEVGRGPLFGRVYAACVVLPKNDSFNHSCVKDSKKFTSSKKIEEVASYIKKNAIAWHVSFEDEATIDSINILQATQRAMHSAIFETRKILVETLSTDKHPDILLLIDGNYFNPSTFYNKSKKIIEEIPHICIEKGDNTYTSIAAASILAKVERDKYINDLCLQHPELITNYSIDSNKGYGAKKHIDGIKLHGVSKWHRMSFGICKMYTPVE